MQDRVVLCALTLAQSPARASLAGERTPSAGVAASSNNLKGGKNKDRTIHGQRFVLELEIDLSAAAAVRSVMTQNLSAAPRLPRHR